MPRLQPLDPPYSPETADALRRLMGGADADPLNLFRTIAHHDVLLDRFRSLGSTLLSFGRLPALDRETVIHRVTARCGADYEWGVHAALFAPAVGLDAQATWSGGREDFADPRQALLVEAVDALIDHRTVDDALWERLRTTYADDELVELVCVVGFYVLVSLLCRTFAIEPEPWAVTP